MATPSCDGFCAMAAYTQTWDRWIHAGGMELTNVTDGIYRHRSDDTYQTRIASYGGSGDEVALCPGNLSTSLTVFETGVLKLGSYEKVLQRTETDTAISGPADLDPFPTLFPPMHITYDENADPSNPTPPATPITKYNYIGVIITRNVHDTHWLDQEAVKDFNGNYISWDQNQYNDALTTEYENYLTNGDLNTLDGLDNGTGTKYLFPHVANS